jgi:subtilisin family serine protease
MIDSGFNPSHPHAQPIACGVHIKLEGDDDCFNDFLGHGTAVAGAIREKAPAAETYAIKIFDRELITSGQILFRALDWCRDKRINFVNLSLGTQNPSYIPAFQERIARAQELGSTIVAAYEMDGKRAFPGSLPGVASVLLDYTCPRNQYVEVERDGRTVYAAAGYPRDISRRSFQAQSPCDQLRSGECHGTSGGAGSGMPQNVATTGGGIAACCCTRLLQRKGLDVSFTPTQSSYAHFTD